MSTSHEQKQKRAAQVLDATRRLIAERGVESVNMRDLAAESRVSVPTLYKLLGDKEHILSQAMQKHLSELFQEIVRNAGKPGVERFLALLEYGGRSIIDLGNYSREVIGHLLQNNMKDIASEQVADVANQYLARALAEMRQSGQLEDWSDPSTMAEHVTIHVLMCCFAWHSAYITDAALPACIVYGGAMIALGPSKGAARKLIEKKIQEVQPEAVAGKRKRGV